MLEEARADLDRLTGAPAGQLRIGAVASAAAGLVSSATTNLATEHPEIELIVSVAEPGRSLDQLLQGDLDIAIVDIYDGVPVPLPDYLVSLPLGSEPLVVVSRPGLLRSTKASLAALADFDWVMPPSEAACGQAVRFACRAEGFEPRVRWESDDMFVLVRAVAAGHGIAVLPRLAVADDAAEVEIRRLTAPALSRRLIALTRASSQGRSVVQATLAALQKFSV